MMTAEEIRLRKQKRRRILTLGTIVIGILLAGFLGAKPTLHAIKSWQARRHAGKAFAAIENGAWFEARKEAAAAYQLRPQEPQAVRAVARFLSRTRQPDALQFWKELEKISSLTPQDLQDEAAIAIAAGESTRAETAVRELLKKDNSDVAGLILSAQLSIQSGSADDAMSALRKIFDEGRATEPQQLQAALLELALASGSESNDDRARDAWSRIEKLSRGKSATALDALVLLARQSIAQSPTGVRLIAMTSEEIRQEIERHPLAKAPQKLLALDLEEHADASRRDDLIAKGIAEWRNGDAKDLQALASWLNGKKEFEKTLEAIPLEKALQTREIFLQYLDALGGLDRWSEIKQLLESDRFPLDPVVQKMYLARCNTQLGEKTAAENNWQRALEAAAGDPGKLVTVGEYAEKNGIFDIAKSAFETAVHAAPRLRVAQQGRLRMAQRTGDTNKIHAALADMLKVWPNDAAVQNDEGYTRLLLLGSNQPQGESRNAKVENNSSDLDQLADIAAKLVEKNPRSLPHRTFLALARLKQNRAADALSVYDNVTIAPGALTPSALAVHAAVLAANGRAEEAQNEARQVKIENLLPEEKALLDGLPYD